MTISWNKVTIFWNEVTERWNEMTWNEVTMERSDRIPLTYKLLQNIVSGGGLVRKPGEHQRERLLFDFITIT